MKRLPILPTIIVALCVAAMIALGVWQLRRAAWKDALVARYAVAERAPPVAFPSAFPIDEAILFRRSSAVCVEPVAWTAQAGRARSGRSGWRHIVSCRTGAEGPGLIVDAGVSDSADPPKGWRGGLVTGTIAWAPSHQSVIARAFGKALPLSPMLVADAAAPGLDASERPSPADIPNNHLSYAVQWFAFAFIAALIYALALRKRGSGNLPPSA
jgi:surfeit locus 1 family protein